MMAATQEVEMNDRRQPAGPERGGATGRPERIVVGYDGSADGRAAIAWSVRRAGPRGVVVVVTAWSPQTRSGTGVTAQREWLVEDQHDAIHAALAPCPPASRPAISGRLVMADPATALSHEARTADRLVLGLGHGRVAAVVGLALATYPRSFGGLCPLTVVRRAPGVGGTPVPWLGLLPALSA
jgi:Universal stress protein family